MMRKMFLALAGAAALVSANAASAVVVIDEIDGAVLETFGSEFFGANRTADEFGAFNDVFNFTTTIAWDANSQVSTILISGIDIDFTSITLGIHNFVQTGFDPGTETWELGNIFLPAGNHALIVNGQIAGAGGGAYSGTIQVTQPVPEPGTWAMMLLGFGGIGYAMRRRRKPLLQLA